MNNPENPQHKTTLLGHNLRTILPTVLAATVALIILLIITFLIVTPIQITIHDYTPTEEAQLSDNVLTFPVGWSPVTCEQRSSTTCHWICTDGHSNYRECTPARTTLSSK